MPADVSGFPVQGHKARADCFRGSPRFSEDPVPYRAPAGVPLPSSFRASGGKSPFLPVRGRG